MPYAIRRGVRGATSWDDPLPSPQVVPKLVSTFHANFCARLLVTCFPLSEYLRFPAFAVTANFGDVGMLVSFRCLVATACSHRALCLLISSAWRSVPMNSKSPYPPPTEIIQTLLFVLILFRPYNDKNCRVERKFTRGALELARIVNQHVKSSILAPPIQLFHDFFERFRD